MKAESIPTAKPITTAEQSFLIAYPHLNGLDHEEFWVLFLNTHNEPIAFEMMTSGGWDSTIIDVRQIFSKALKYSSTAIVIFHNHLSGNCCPSDNDIKYTLKVRAAGDLMDIRLIDHLILSGKRYYSFCDEEVVEYNE